MNNENIVKLRNIDKVHKGKLTAKLYPNDTSHNTIIDHMFILITLLLC